MQSIVRHTVLTTLFVAAATLAVPAQAQTTGTEFKPQVGQAG